MNVITRLEVSRWSRRRFLGAAASASVAGALGCRARSPDPSLKIGYLPITDATPLLIGDAQGFFAGQGLTVEKPTLMRAWSDLTDGFASGAFNVVHLLLPLPMFMRYSQNLKVKVVAWNHTNGSAMTVASNENIHSFAELGGKQIAVPNWYSMHNIILQAELRHANLQVMMQERSIPLLPNQTNLFVMKPPDMPTALSTGAVDGYIVAEPFDAAGEVLAKASILRFTGDIFRNHPCCVVVMKEDMIAQHPAWAQKVVNGLVESQKWVINNREQTAHVLSRDGHGYLPMAEPLLRKALLDYNLETYGVDHGTGAIQHPEWGSRRVGFQPYPYESATRKVVELLKQTKVGGDASFLQTLDAERVVRELFNYSMVKKAIDRAGGLAQFDGVDAKSPYERTEEIDL